MEAPGLIAAEGAPPFGRRSQAVDKGFRWVTAATAAGLILLLIALILVLIDGSTRIFSTFGLSFFTGTDWNTVPGRESFGALPFIYGTLVTSFVAVFLAVPVSVGLALLLNEVRSGWLSNPLATFVDVLAAIPSIVYGLWGLFVLKPFLDKYIEPALQDTLGKIPVIGHLFSGTTVGPDLFSAGVILAIMIVPIITAVTREVVATVPRELREAAKAIGATRYETIRLAVLPYARSGIVGATMLGLGRALGETIAVSLLVGNTTRDQHDPVRGGRHDPLLDREQLPRRDQRRAASVGAPRARARADRPHVRPRGRSRASSSGATRTSP